MKKPSFWTDIVEANFGHEVSLFLHELENMVLLEELMFKLCFQPGR